jgi:hypothetical protein
MDFVEDDELAMLGAKEGICILDLSAIRWALEVKVHTLPG